jgi:5'-3' exonuclease
VTSRTPIPVHDLIVLWDGEAQHRSRCYPEYKANRKAAEAADPEKAAERGAYRAQVPLIQASMKALGVRQMKCHVLEADDLAGYFAPKLSAAGQNVLLVTGDSDWWQLVNERVSWLDPRQDGRKVNHANFLEQTGFHTPGEYLQAKALMGDSTDGIPPAGGIGEKGAQELMARFKSVPEFWRQCDAGTFVPASKATRGSGRASVPRRSNGRPGHRRRQGRREGVQEIHAAVAGRHPGELGSQHEANEPASRAETRERDSAASKRGEYEPDKFRVICERLAFVSLLKDYDTFVEPFAKQWASRQEKVAA